MKNKMIKSILTITILSTTIIGSTFLNGCAKDSDIIKNIQSEFSSESSNVNTNENIFKQNGIDTTDENFQKNLESSVDENFNDNSSNNNISNYEVDDNVNLSTMRNQITADSVDSNEVQDLISQITIAPEDNYNYDRDSYTSNSQSYEYNGEKYSSIRNYSYYASIFYNDYSQIFTDPYNNVNYDNPKSMDFDHIIPLHYVNQHGGATWTEEEKKAFADNPTIGVDVNSHDNRSKGDKGPSEWLPECNQDDYCYSWLVIAAKYNISLTQEDMDTIVYVITNETHDGLTYLGQYK